MVKKAECIQKLSENPSKVEEIEFIAAVARSIPENSYLKSFFSQKMVNKILQNIQNDFCSDFDEMVEQIVNERLTLKKEQMEAQLQRDITEMQRIIKECEDRAIKADHEANNARRDRDEAYGKLDKIQRISSGW